ncbi:hypothetical protein FZI85_07770 [Mycobacterium sp. CBMA293]|uniref:hypothetical protein n=1 Tax=unclassified Mycolicibacterium TaxID=2636767 RepID=UPI0012DFCC5F|nr:MULTISPECIES: hypothetical protein [unclassified Mycolicibacterium]MUL46502.1 hypothetical protein [Mycolicibacterium sp. CBMA 360]MUL56986.1 hypothetical protein [Mycolicibacterium sp. CBMA 335]MUL70026.1 hypothetical protein [Mycolicibacterium sp. CBMA 311]MUL92074.1 hypothetical protein [Mycolicibacterium sp. CBMA 230]MUM10930.1 hypothetical protein [Mycolicibacterium sp. CBMA 293]
MTTTSSLVTHAQDAHCRLGSLPSRASSKRRNKQSRSGCAAPVLTRLEMLRQIIVRSVPRDEPDLKHLARAVVQLAKDMQTAKALGVSVEEARRLHFPDTRDD